MSARTMAAAVALGVGLSLSPAVSQADSAWQYEVDPTAPVETVTDEPTEQPTEVPTETEEPTTPAPTDDDTDPSDGTATHHPVGECPPWHPDDREPVACQDDGPTPEQEAEKAPAPAVEQRCSARRCVRVERHPDGTTTREVTEYDTAVREEGF